jgi:Arm domain-containing DNA-binding protein
MLTETRLRRVKPLRAPRKLFDGAGLHLLVAPNGGRYWRYNYRFNGKEKTLSLGVYPEVSLAMARARHQEARRLLADGIEPPSSKKQAFARLARTQADV